MHDVMASWTRFIFRAGRDEAPALRRQVFADLRESHFGSVIDVRHRILAKLRDDGIIVLAGILRREFDKVRRAYEKAGLELIKCGVQKEWRSGTFGWR